MNIILFVSMSLVGFWGFCDELRNKKTNKGMFLLFALLFLGVVLSRIGTKYMIDLVDYIDYYKNDIVSYFEPGYVFMTNVTKTLLGHNPYALVLMTSLWLITFVLYAARICRDQSRDRLDTYSFRATSYHFSLFFFVCLYWGVFYAGETLRIGMATSLLYCAAAFFINDKFLKSLIFSILAVFFQTSTIIFFIGLCILYFIKQLPRKAFIFWFIIILLSRLFFRAVPSFLQDMVNNLVDIEMFNHYKEYADIESSVNTGFSPQDIAYHAFGLIMLKGNLDSNKYNKAVMLYYTGLTVGALFQFSEISMRLMWIFLSMIIFVLYYFVLDKQFSLKTKIRIVALYSVIEFGMAIRQFGWFIL